MLRRVFLFVMLIICFAGCATTHKAQILPVAPKSLAGQEEPSTSEKDKVWVEAETKKIWVNNHVDESGDMVEGHYKHIIVTPGHWAVKDGGKR